MLLGTQVGLRKGDIMLDGTPKKEHSSPHFLSHVYCGETAGWIKMSFGTEVGLGPGTLCYMGTQLRPHKGHSSHPILGPRQLWTFGWMDQHATWYEVWPQRRRHGVRWHVQIARHFEPSTVLWAFHTIQPS